MREVLFAGLTGAAAGFLFYALRLPVPAPPTLAGVAGVLGLFLGYLLGRQIWPR